MNIEAYRNYCIAKKGVTESFPFDDRVLVFKVGGKMFALIDIEDLDFVNCCQTGVSYE
jgi:predicted DNA-binding protein (MmcQ/YjbR family)